MKILLGDFNAKVGRENILKPTVGNESLHQDSNDNGVRIVNFAKSKIWLLEHDAPDQNIHEEKTHNQIDHILIERMWHSSVLDVRSYRGAHFDTDHYLVVAKVTERLTVNKQAAPKFDGGRI
jgi:endonuclease/exonuclease/phosphatase family metal-dependent hydrolase